MFDKLPQKEQISTFEKLSHLFSDYLSNISKKDNSIFIKDEWINNINSLKNQMLPIPNINFLNLTEIRGTMFVAGDDILLSKELNEVESFFKKEELMQILLESNIGNPELCHTINDYKTSHNCIHHLYHLTRYLKSTNLSNLNSINNIIEWGGGYGNMTKLILSINPNINSYTIIDLPFFTSLQWIYLSSIFGESKINLVTEDNMTIKDGCINLVSIDFVNEIIFKSNDLFISTWALSESTLTAHDFVVNKNWFNSNKFLIGFHQCGEHIPFMKESNNIKNLLENFCKIEDVKVVPGVNYYAFK